MDIFCSSSAEVHFPRKLPPQLLNPKLSIDRIVPLLDLAFSPIQLEVHSFTPYIRGQVTDIFFSYDCVNMNLVSEREIINTRTYNRRM